MRNTQKKQTYDNVVENSEELSRLIKQIRENYQIDEMPYSFEYRRWEFEEIINKKIKEGNFKITGFDIIEQFSQWLDRDERFPARISKLTKDEAIAYFPKQKETIQSRGKEFVYYYLRSYNPNAHKNLYNIIAHLVDASSDNQMQIIHNESRREALFGVSGLDEIDGYVNGYYRRARWTYYVSEFHEVFKREYKWYE